MGQYVLRKNCTDRLLFKSCWGTSLFDLNFNSNILEAKRYEILYLVYLHSTWYYGWNYSFWSGVFSVKWHIVSSGSLECCYSPVHVFLFLKKNHIIAWFWLCRKKMMFPSLLLKNVWDIAISCGLPPDGPGFFIFFTRCLTLHDCTQSWKSM